MHALLPSWLATALALVLAACGLSGAQQTQIATSVGTLAGVAIANNTTARAIVDGGVLICQAGAAYRAVLGVNVTGAPAAVMAGVCGALGAVGAALPSNVPAESVEAVTVPLRAAP